MKTLTSAVLVSLAVLSTGAFASQNIEPNDVPFQGVYSQSTSSVSRADVSADLQQAKAKGLYTFGELDYPAVQMSRQSLSRDQVKAELAQAKASGQYSFGELDH